MPTVPCILAPEEFMTHDVPASDGETLHRQIGSILELAGDPAFPGDVGGGDAGTQQRIRELTAPLLERISENEVALVVIHLLGHRVFSTETGVEVAASLLEHHAGDSEVLGLLGRALEGVHDLRLLNGPPPSHPVFRNVATKLQQHVKDATSVDAGMIEGLATSARLLGRSWDKVAERELLDLVKILPDSWGPRYDLGLFYKTRGRFAEGQAANKAAWERGGHEDPGVLWNFGICATGARDGETALGLWKRMGQNVEKGRRGLPEGRYPATKVRLAQRPLAERGGNGVPDDPGLEETIWVERLSPCHGVIRSAVYQDDIGVDFGDLILFDGAPVTYHMVGDQRTPVFPHLATLSRENYRIHRFAGEQEEKGQLAALSGQMPHDAVVYVHTEQVHSLCARCWEDPGNDHAAHQQFARHIVTGKICAPPELPAAELRRILDDLLGVEPAIKLYAPELTAAAGDASRAATERRFVEALGRSLSSE